MRQCRYVCVCVHVCVCVCEKRERFGSTVLAVHHLQGWRRACWPRRRPRPCVSPWSAPRWLAPRVCNTPISTSLNVAFSFFRTLFLSFFLLMLFDSDSVLSFFFLCLSQLLYIGAPYTREENSAWECDDDDDCCCWFERAPGCKGIRARKTELYSE